MFLGRVISNGVGVPDHLTLFFFLNPREVSIEMVKLATCHSKLA